MIKIHSIIAITKYNKRMRKASFLNKVRNQTLKHASWSLKGLIQVLVIVKLRTSKKREESSSANVTLSSIIHPVALEVKISPN